MQYPYPDSTKIKGRAHYRPGCSSCCTRGNRRSRSGGWPAPWHPSCGTTGPATCIVRSCHRVRGGFELLLQASLQVDLGPAHALEQAVDQRGREVTSRAAGTDEVAAVAVAPHLHRRVEEFAANPAEIGAARQEPDVGRQRAEVA